VCIRGPRFFAPVPSDVASPVPSGVVAAGRAMLAIVHGQCTSGRHERPSGTGPVSVEGALYGAGLDGEEACSRVDAARHAERWVGAVLHVVSCDRHFEGVQQDGCVMDL
jgi:hypothetical protein